MRDYRKPLDFETREIGGQIVYPVDCILGFDLFDDESIDHIVTSPPYNLGGFHSNDKKRNYNGFDDEEPEDEYRAFIKLFISKCHRVLKKNGSFFLNMKTRIINKQAIPPYWVLEGNPFILKQDIIWNYPSTANVDKVRFFPLHEYVFWFIKDKDNFTFNEEWAIIGNVWRISHITDRKETSIKTISGDTIQHPAPFPTRLPQTTILSTTNEGDTVLDPFLGSGTTLKVCRFYKRKGLGFEKYLAKYEPIMNRRILSNEMPPTLLEEMNDRNTRANTL